MTQSELATVARCSKCGRGFVTEPKSYPAYDPFLPKGTRGKDSQTTPACNGEIVRVDAEETRT